MWWFSRGKKKEELEISKKLKVLREDDFRFVGKRRARIDPASMDALKVSFGDLIEIKGRKRTVGICSELPVSDQNRGLIRMDGLLRTNSETDVGDMVSIKKTVAKIVEDIVVKPLVEIPSTFENRHFLLFVVNTPFVKGDVFKFEWFGQRLLFEVIAYAPYSDVGFTTSETRFHMTY